MNMWGESFSLCFICNICIKSGDYDEYLGKRFHSDNHGFLALCNDCIFKIVWTLAEKERLVRQKELSENT